jgi:DNA-binding GntR family transcriptional regulator
VSLIDTEQVEESTFVRQTLEYEVIQQACRSFPADELFQLQSCLALQKLCISEKNFYRFFELDETMHGIIFRGCKKNRTWEMLQLMNAHYNRVRVLSLKTKEFKWDQLLEHHQELIKAIQEQDVELGRKIIKLHLHKVLIDLEYLRQAHGDYFLQPKQQTFTMTQK